MKLKSKLAMAVLSLMAATICISMVTVSASHEDTVFSFTFHDDVQTTDLRPKEDDTSMYMKPTALACTFTAFAKAERTSYPFGLSDVSNGYHYKINTVNHEYFIRNWANEWGYQKACICAVPDSGSYGRTATGWWSPDSV